MNDKDKSEKLNLKLINLNLKHKHAIININEIAHDQRSIIIISGEDENLGAITDLNV